MQRALKNLLVQGTLDGAPSSGTLDLSLCTVYLPANISSGDYKQSVRVATTANGTISTAFANGQTVDGITLATGDRILLKDQSSQAANGIYVVAASGSPARASDFDSWLELPGAVVTVEVGTVNAGTQWACNVAAGGTLGSTAITFVVPKNFLDLTSNQSVAGVKTFANVVLTTADINGGTMDAVVIGGTTPAAGTFTTINGNAITGSGTLALSTYTLTATATGNVAITGGNLSQFAATTSAQLAGVLNDETGTGVLVFNNSPSVITPAIQANALSFSTILTTAATGSNKTVTFPDAAGTVLLSGDIGVSVQAYDADLTTWAGITPGAGVATFLATPSSANLAAAVTGETGSGALVFGTSPTFTTSILIPDGTAGTPGINFSADTNTGIYRIGADNIGIATNGTLRWHVSSGGSLFSGSGNYDYNIGAALFKGSSGSASAPTFTFGSSGDENTGMYRVGEDQIGFTAGGTLRATINTTDLILTVGLTLPKTITAGGTTGAQTINKTSGSVNFAAGATSLVVTNSLVTTSSVILVTGATNDVDQSVFVAEAAAGSFTIYPGTAGGYNVVPYAETRVNFLVLN